MPTLVSESVVIVLCGSTAEEWARLLLPELPALRSPDQVLEHFAATGDVSSLPSFFVGSADDTALRCIVRGAFRVETRMDHGESLTIEGSSARTWSEMVLEDVTLATMTYPGVEAGPELRPLRPGPHSAASVRFAPAGAAPRPPLVEAPGARAIGAVEAVSDDTLPPARLSDVPAAMPAPVPARSGAGTYDALFGSVTVVGSIESAAIRDPAAQPAIPGAPETGVDPHFDSREAALSAVVCTRHHANPPSRSRCWQCSEPLEGSPVVRVARPALGELAFEDGRVIPLARTVLIGRSPRADRTDATGIPELVVVPSPNNDVSRTHARIFLDGWQVLIEDLGSTNGTIVTDRSGDSRRIRAGEPAILVDGTRIDLGDGVRFTAVGVP